MFISNKKNCSFDIYCNEIIDFKNIHVYENVEYDEIFGCISFKDEYINLVKNYYISYIWQRLINETLIERRQRKNLHLYNPYTLFEEIDEKEITHVEDDILFNKKTNDLIVTKSNSIDKNDKRKFHIEKCLEELVPFEKFIKTIYGLSPLTVFETYQRSIIFNILFFRIIHDCGYSRLQRFLYGMSNIYFGFSPYKFDFIMNAYSKKHSLSIIQRGLGKTTIQTWIAAAAMLCLKNIRILLVAQSRNMVTSTHNEVKHLIQKYNNSSQNILTTPLDVLNYYVNNKSSTEKINAVFDKFNAIKEGHYDHVNKLISVSATKDSSLRGKDPHIILTDEAFSIPRNNHATLLAMGHRKHCQINYFSSPVHNNPELHLNAIVDLNNNEGINLFRMTTFCTKKSHQKYISSQRACPNLEFYIPPFITYSDDNRLVTDIMTSGQNDDNLPYYVTQLSATKASTYQQELGIVKKSDLIRALKDRDPSSYDVSDNAAFSKTFFDFLTNRSAYIDVSKINCKIKQRELLDSKFKLKEEKCKHSDSLNHVDLFMYIDPSYNADTQSGIGLCCIFKPDVDSKKIKEYVVTYMDHKFLTSSEIANVPEIIIIMVKNCIEANRMLFASQSILNFFIAIENNSSQAGVAQIHQRLSQFVIKTSESLRYNIYLYVTKNHKRAKITLGYNLGSNKRAMFSVGINMSNENMEQKRLSILRQ